MSSSGIGYAMLAGVGLFIVFLAFVMHPSGREDLPTIMARFDRYIDGDPDLSSQEEDEEDATFWHHLVAKPKKLITSRARQSEDNSRWHQVAEREQRLSESLERADLKFRTSEWTAILFGSGVVIFAFSWWRFGLLPAILLALVIPKFGGGFYIGFRQNKRTKAFASQLGDVINKISNALKVGHAFTQALASIETGTPAPASKEFGRVVKEMELGASSDDALHRMAKRCQSEDLTLMVTAININRVVGGNLAETLDNLAETIRERVRIKGEIATLTAQARASGWVISILPVALGGILMVIAPDYFKPLLHDGIGLALLGAGGFLLLLGILIIRKIVDIEI